MWGNDYATNFKKKMLSLLEKELMAIQMFFCLLENAQRKPVIHA